MQEYTEEFRDITKGTKSKESLPVAPITLINQRPVGDDLHVCAWFLFSFSSPFEFHWVFIDYLLLLIFPFLGRFDLILGILANEQKTAVSWDEVEAEERRLSQVDGDETAIALPKADSKPQPPAVTRKRRSLGLRKLSDLSNMLSLY